MRTSNLDLNLLKVFVAVADQGSFTRAAELLFVEQPSVTKAVRRLEEDLGVRLFDRSKHSVGLSEHGHRLLPLATSVLKSSEDFLRVARLTDGEESSLLRMGIDSALGVTVAPRVLKELSRNFPALWTQLQSGIAIDILTRIRRQELDFGLLFTAPPMGGDVVAIEIARVSFSIVIKSLHPPAALDSFIGSREIHTGATENFPSFSALKEKNEKLRFRFSVNDSSAYLALILEGLGCGVLPNFFIEEQLRDGKLKALRAEKTEYPLYLITVKDRKLSAEAHAFIEGIQRELGA